MDSGALLSTLVGLVIVGAIISLVVFMVNKSRREKLEKTNPGLSRKVWMVVGAICAVWGILVLRNPYGVAAAEFGGTYQFGIYWGDPKFVEWATLQGEIFVLGGVASLIRGYLKKS